MCRANLAQELWQSAIACEGKQHAGSRCHRSKTTQELCDENSNIENHFQGWVDLGIHCPEKHVPALLGCFVHVRDHQNKCAQHHPSEKAGIDDGIDHTARNSRSGNLCFLCRMRRRIISRDRVNRQQQTQYKGHQPANSHRPHAARAFRAGIVGECVQAGKVERWC